MNNGVKIYFLILLISILSGCGRSKDVKQITYSFSVDLEDPFNVFIAYKDSDGYKTLYIDREWTKDVYLGSGDAASLLIIPQTRAKIKYTGKIICNDNIKTTTSSNIVSLSVATDSL